MKVFGRVKVRDRQTQADNSLVPCDCRQVVHPDSKPLYLQPLDESFACKISLFTESATPDDDLLAKLNKLMMEEGKKVDVVQALLSTDAPQENSPKIYHSGSWRPVRKEHATYQ